MNEKDFLAERFEENREHLRTVAYRMLGSLDEAGDAVQQTWLRLNRSNEDEIHNLGGWLTTVVARVCLDMLRSRRMRREESLDHSPVERIPDPIIAPEQQATDPEREAMIADSVGLALLVVLETLSPAERLAFVLHDTFAVPFDEIAPIVGRSPDATRKLASRARRRIRGTTISPDTDLTHQRKVVDAYLSASRKGDFDALLEVLDPDIVVRADFGEAPSGGVPGELRGARSVAEQALTFSQFAGNAQPVLVNGTAGIISLDSDGRPFSVLGFTVRNGRIVEINVLADPERLRRLDLPI